MRELKILSDCELVSETEKSVSAERTSTAEVIRHLQEINRRKLYLDRGFPNLYEMVTKHFGYCAGSAMRRISSMRLVNELPEIEAKIESGELSLTAAASVQSFFYSESKEARPYTRSQKMDLLETCLGKSSRDVERELCKRNPEREKREFAKHVSADRVRVSFTISEELNAKLETLKRLLAHVDSSMSTESLIERLAELGLEKFDPVRKAKRARAPKQSRDLASATEPGEQIKPPQAPPPPPAREVRSRYIPAIEIHEANLRCDSQGCEFVDAESGRRCGSRQLLQKDHVIPFSKGGPNSAENLRIYCAAHNRVAWRGHSQSRVRCVHLEYG